MSRKNKYLSLDEEVALGKDIKKYKDYLEEVGGSPTDSQKRKLKKLKKKRDNSFLILYENNKDLAYSIANSFYRTTGSDKHYAIEDLAQDALFALSKAIDRYDPDKNCKVNTFARYTIMKEVSTAINKARRISYSVTDMYRWGQITSKRKLYEELHSQDKDYSERKRDEWVAEDLNIPIEEIVFMNETINFHTSLNKLVGDGEEEVIDLIKDTSEDRKTRRWMEETFPYLDEKQIEILDSTYGITDKSLSEEEMKEKLKIRSKRALNLELKKILSLIKKETSPEKLASA